MSLTPIPRSHSGVYCWLVTFEVVMLRHCLRHNWKKIEVGDGRKNINPPTTSVTADVHHVPVVVVVSRVFQCFKI